MLSALLLRWLRTAMYSIIEPFFCLLYHANLSYHEESFGLVLPQASESRPRGPLSPLRMPPTGCRCKDTELLSV